MYRRKVLAGIGLVALAGVTFDRVAAAADDIVAHPGDIEVGDRHQEVVVTVTGIETDSLVVGLDVRALAAANVEIGDLAVSAPNSDFYGGTLRDWTVDGRDVSLMIDVDDDTDAIRGIVRLEGLETTAADHSPELTYGLGTATEDAAVDYTAKSETFAVIDPDERPPALTIRPDWIAHGDDTQSLAVQVSYPPVDDELVVDVNIAGLVEADVDIGSLLVSATAETAATIRDTGLLEREGVPVVRVRFTATADDLAALHVTLGGLESDEAATTGATYYGSLGVDGPPAVPDRDAHDDRAEFFVGPPSEVTGHDTDRPGGTSQATDASGDGGVDEADPGDDVDPEAQPGFGPIAALAGLLGGLAVGVRRVTNARP